MASKSKTASKDAYSLDDTGAQDRVEAPAMPYQPPRPKAYTPRIGLIGCGGITTQHLTAYQQAGYEVVALTDLERERAEARRDAFFPDATIESSADDLLARSDVQIVDLALHPAERAELLLSAIDADKHVLSQKPFVTDLDFGQKVVDAAREKGVKVAVNQNGRWAPHVAYMRQAIREGWIGDLVSIDLSVHWSHNGFAGTAFDDIPNLILYDFAIHWFDMVHCYTPGLDAESVYARSRASRSQETRAPLLSHAMIEFPHAQASLVFRADTRHTKRDRSVIVGTKGALISEGPNLNEQSVSLFTDKGEARPELEGSWFPAGFDGTMSELVCAIEADREPINSAADNLASLELCFAAIQSAETGQIVTPGEARRIEPGWLSYQART